MVTKTNLALMGMPVFLARSLGVTPVITSAAGTSAGTAQGIPGDQFLTIVQVTTGSGMALPQVGGDWSANGGAQLGDEYNIFNQTAAIIQIYALTNAAGSAITMYVNAVSAVGTTGISLQAGMMASYYAVTPSTYIGTKVSV